LHTPVLLNEVIEYLKPEPGDVVVDATLGCAGHAEAVLTKISPGGSLIGVDQDEEALHCAEERLKKFSASSYRVVKANFGDLDKVLGNLNVTKVDGMIFDLGVSSLELDDATRGFSLQKDGPLDMRMDRSGDLTAYDVVNRYPEDKLVEIIRSYGEERHARIIASTLVRARRSHKISGTAELAGLIERTIGRYYRKYRIHSATRTFQAIRIEVNRELERLTAALSMIPDLLAIGGRACIISFHSLEDRIVKNQFRDYAHAGRMKILTKKPVTPAGAECSLNPRARSAKLRAAEIIG